jgi:mannose-6-phosphate isomerase
MNDSAPLFKLENTIRNYAWGSYDGLSLYAGIEQDPAKPSAECWMGAHPEAPSAILLPGGGKLSLQKFIREFPIKSLGEEVFCEFGDLPFLFKVLSASMPLSIQVHPDKAAAEKGFDAEEKLGIPRNAPERNYRDRNHKPELAVALSRFSALCGFRAPAEAADLLGPELREYFGFAPDKARDSFKALLSKALTLRDKEKAALESRATARAKELARSADGAARAAGEATLMCFGHYPRDPGAISPLFMAVLDLEPGQGLYIPAGVMHAYLKGTILEIMATSDNVIRGGLTHKHIDVEDLLGILDFEASPLLVEPKKTGTQPGEFRWDTPAREFALSSLDAEKSRISTLTMTGPEILLCTEGSIALDCLPGAENGRGRSEENAGGVSGILLKRGESAFIGASCSAYILKGEGKAYRASMGGSTGGER